MGAWESRDDGMHMYIILSEKHFAVVVSQADTKEYQGTFGGSWSQDKGEIVLRHEFNTLNADMVGQEKRPRLTVTPKTMEFAYPDRKLNWTRVDDGSPGKLAGAWLITGRMSEKGMTPITPGARKTMKILSGTRFQWIAYNSDTKEFFGTGAGTYTTIGGKYTETIEFFSRDRSRVGMQLSFDFSIEDGVWHHKGLSSKGDPIDEFWSRREKLGL